MRKACGNCRHNIEKSSAFYRGIELPGACVQCFTSAIMEGKYHTRWEAKRPPQKQN